jgi:TPP-dependent pyruvate/acetoin dehydrogenase alpha subunit
MNNDALLKHYEEMVVLHEFDELCLALKKRDIIFSGYHPTVGQEAVAVGFCGALKHEDVLLSTHRAHCHAVAKGCPQGGILTEMMGRRTGSSGGIGGAMQILDAPNNVYSGSIVGSNIAMAPGFGMVMKQKKMDAICMCIFGDGASNTGSFHEGLNLAAIWKLPIIFVCENNLYAEAMPSHEFLSCEYVSQRAAAYGLEVIRVDGNDVEASRKIADELIERTRNGEGPFLVEAMTYRIRGHYVGDPESTYRTKEEVDEWRKKDPILLAGIKLKENGVSQDALDAILVKVENEMDELETWALEQEFPTLEEAISHVYIPIEKGVE